MSFLQTKISEIKNIMDTSPKSYVIYLFSFSIFFSIGIGLFFISQELFYWYINKSVFFFVPFIIIAFLLDAKWLINNIAKTKLGRLLYAFLAYIAYALAEMLSKDITYALTSADPEQFGSAIKFLVSIYFIPAWAIIITLVISITVGLTTLLLWIIFIILQFFTFFKTIPFYIKIEKKIILNIQKRFHFQHNILMHMAFFTIGLMIFGTIWFIFTDGIPRLIPEKKIASIILSNTSYYKNQVLDNKNLTCNKIPINTYIKLIGDNRASILILEPNIYDVNFNIDKNITFKIAECN